MEILLSELPDVLINLFQIILFQAVECSEGYQNLFEADIILQIGCTEGCKAILVTEVTQNLSDVTVIDWEVQRLVVTAILSCERIEVFFYVIDIYPLDITHNRNISNTQSRIDVQ